MRFHDEQLRILKNLFIKQKESPNKATFTAILERVDEMLTETISKFSKIYYFDEKIPQLLQDMYQTGIIGLSIAIDTFDPKRKETAIPIWIFHSVRNELFRTYRVRNLDILRYAWDHPDSIKNTGIDSELIREDIRQVLKDLILSGEMSEEDLELLVLRHIEKMSIPAILKSFGDKWGKNRITVSKRIDALSTILRRAFREKGLGT